jgi:uncharacterized LabA/DUF88 family protein
VAAKNRTLVITTVDQDAARRQYLEAQGIRVLALVSQDTVFEPSQILDALSAEGVRTLLVHGDEKTHPP